MDHTSDRYKAQVVRLKRRKVHQYEDVENPQPDEHTEEPVSDRERTLTDGDKMVEYEYSELEHQAETNVLQTTDLEGDQGEPHTYEIILAVGQDKDKTAVNTKQQLQIESSQYYEDVCDNKNCQNNHKVLSIAFPLAVHLRINTMFLIIPLLVK